MKSPGMSPPAITIGIMTRNYGRYIREAIDSVLAQSRTDWELVISDDASTDDTSDIIQPYLSDPRITYVRHETNLGQADNWGFLLNQGGAPLLTVLHADDYWLPCMLDTVLSAFAADPLLDLLYGNWWRQVEGKNNLVLAKQEQAHTFSGHDEYRYQVKRHTWLPSATVLTRSAADLAGRPDADLKMLVDTEYFLRVALHARRVRAITEPLMVYRVHGGNATAEGIANDRLNAEKEMLPSFCARHVMSVPTLHGCIAALRYVCAWHIFDAGVVAAANGNRKAGQELMKRGVRLCPALLSSTKILAKYLLCYAVPGGCKLLRSLYLYRLRSPSTATIVSH